MHYFILRQQTPFGENVYKFLHPVRKHLKADEQQNIIFPKNTLPPVSRGTIWNRKYRFVGGNYADRCNNNYLKLKTDNEN